MDCRFTLSSVQGTEVSGAVVRSSLLGAGAGKSITASIVCRRVPNLRLCSRPTCEPIGRRGSGRVEGTLDGPEANRTEPQAALER